MRQLLNGKLKCSLCNKWKELNKFVPKKRGPYKVSSWCKSCRNKWLKKTRRYHTKYGLTDAQYESLKQHFDNRCGACGKTEKRNKQRLAIDHQHASRRVRGLLCKTCNAGIGLLGDTVEGVTKALQYLLSANNVIQTNNKINR